VIIFIFAGARIEEELMTFSSQEGCCNGLMGSASVASSYTQSASITINRLNSCWQRCKMTLQNWNATRENASRKKTWRAQAQHCAQRQSLP
jgi:hypothetical protein